MMNLFWGMDVYNEAAILPGGVCLLLWARSVFSRPPLRSRNLSAWALFPAVHWNTHQVAIVLHSKVKRMLQATEDPRCSRNSEIQTDWKKGNHQITDMPWHAQEITRPLCELSASATEREDRARNALQWHPRFWEVPERHQLSKRCRPQSLHPSSPHVPWVVQCSSRWFTNTTRMILVFAHLSESPSFWDFGSHWFPFKPSVLPTFEPRCSQPSSVSGARLSRAPRVASLPRAEDHFAEELRSLWPQLPECSAV